MATLPARSEIPLVEACRASLQGLRMAKNLLGSARFGVSVQALLPQAVLVQRCIYNGA